MLRFADDLKVYVYREPIDFRCGINTLAALVTDSMRLDPLARAVYAFHNRKRDRIKLLLYERTGFWLLLRRLPCSPTCPDADLRCRSRPPWLALPDTQLAVESDSSR